ncbi:MAG: helix-turn-helix transcriptional regulator [Gemmatimonas sp.]|jgi:PadR family transcriptional regulator PadR|uniref:helix-turn-helix transcriptional regulator n=1 Tax=Gemmatimonas sp. TaxID=1962908 RepID=UPI0022BE2286|nr:helix-turn-helix transcriptional regulator [Gemmatimonas sp.]MCA2984599.1 helix-turn-helix transcriptional regulator [Gemmatimonas sp.]MCA2989335.1 helix-turn-helix transcriptional regulator [Gemmatimonas sp.]MCA2996801.1 helix-turn-helix transcriptional regulator [Gemmatimonas sp.]MCZ8012177.1 helix-turn-helix transcriptional regulator [Gemmatimonas sp.]MCZ8266893.1 helix-turn-helix transcriptional regulator [Gemmatimonas sp.]
MTGMLRGSLEATLLAAVAAQGGGASGLDVRRAVTDRTGRCYAVGAIYTVLQRLEAKGWVTARVADPRPVRGGRVRRLFTVTADGHRALESFRQRAATAWALPIPLTEERC